MEDEKARVRLGREREAKDLAETKGLLLGSECAMDETPLENPFRLPLMRPFTRLWKKPMDLQTEINESIETAREACSKTAPRRGVRFLVRVDDFPWHGFGLAQFREFHSIMEESGIPYLLGVTPRLAIDHRDPGCDRFNDLSHDEIEFLKGADKSVEIGLHGLTHRVSSASDDPNQRSEFIGLSREALRSRFAEGLRLLEGVGRSVDTFVPPYNTFDFVALDVARQYFRQVTGGPESIPHVGLRLTPSVLSGVTYVPSYAMAYGYAREIRRFVDRAKERGYQTLVPLTLHWHWEAERNYRDLRSLARSIQGLAVPWSELTSPSKATAPRP